MATVLYFLLAVAIVAGVGLTIFFITRPVRSGSASLTVTEFVVGLLIACAVVLPLTTWIGGNVAKGQALTYHQWINSLEATAPVQTTVCERDGSCIHTYQCDRYQKWVTHYRTESYTTTETYTKSDGGIGVRTVTRTRQVPYEVLETHYHDCPYAQKELTYSVVDKLGRSSVYASHIFPSDVSDNRWMGEGATKPRDGGGLPGLPSSVPTSPPADWIAAKTRLDAANPGGTTQLEKYTDYWLASHREAAKAQASAIADYREKGLLPRVQENQSGHFGADKVYFPGWSSPEAGLWQASLLRFNGYFAEKQGDLHLVLVPASQVSDPDGYAAALKAYWSSPEMGKNPLAKNGLAVVMGVSGGEVQWTRAFTSVPGNEDLFADLEQLRGGIADPATLLTPQTGKLWEPIMVGPHPYERVNMNAYRYLRDAVKISTTARILTLLVGVLLSCLVWAIFLAVDLRFRPLESLAERMGEGDDSEEVPGREKVRW